MSRVCRSVKVDSSETTPPATVYQTFEVRLRAVPRQSLRARSKCESAPGPPGAVGAAFAGTPGKVASASPSASTIPKTPVRVRLTPHPQPTSDVGGNASFFSSTKEARVVRVVDKKCRDAAAGEDHVAARRGWPVPVALRPECLGDRDPDLSLARLHLGTAKVLLDVDVGATLELVNLVIELLGDPDRLMRPLHRLVPGEFIRQRHRIGSSSCWCAARARTSKTRSQCDDAVE